MRAFFDVYGAAMELGVLPKPGTAGERAMLMLRGFGIRGYRCESPNRFSMPAPEHFITGAELDADRLDLLLHRAAALKEAPRSSRALEGRTVALVFNKPSTRTRTSFESGVFELGGHPMVLRPDEMQLTRGESVRDTALILSRHAAVIGLRTGDEDEINGFAEHATVPVVNMLSPLHHPCQALADLQTMREALGTLDGRVLAYVGDGNNVARSLAIVGALAGVEVRVAAPDGYQLPEGETPAVLTDDPAEAVAGADAVYTDVWVSMSDDEASAAARREALAPYAIDDALLDKAGPDAFALHCLPAHPGRGDHRVRPLRLRASGSGTRPRTAATPRRRCSSCSFRAAGRTGRCGRPCRRSRSESEDTSRSVLNPLDVMVITRERLQDTLDDAVRRGRMTRDDATDLLAEILRRAISAPTDRVIREVRRVTGASPTSSRSPTTTI